MARPEQPAPVKLIAGLLGACEDLLDVAEGRLAAAFGPIDLRSGSQAFGYTDYYRRQMGGDLVRRFVAFERLIAPDRLAEIKLATNAMEDAFARDGDGGVARPVNIDPGYVDTAKLVLASAKNFAHRVYLRDGIYAEVTLQFRHGRWEAAPWTFPDYGSGDYDAFLCGARTLYKTQIGRKR